MEAQDGLCAICRLKPDKPNLDHCHLDGFLRGTLCTSCNTKLGWYEANRRGIETYLALAGEIQAYHTTTRKPRVRKQPLTAAEIGHIPEIPNFPAKRPPSWKEHWDAMEAKRHKQTQGTG